jgi:hypothetical protein
MIAKVASPRTVPVWHSVAPRVVPGRENEQNKAECDHAPSAPQRQQDVHPIGANHWPPQEKAPIGGIDDRG